jgi:hypothetical protein
VDWLLVALLILCAYGLAAWYIRKERLWEDIIAFYGPVMAIKTRKVGFLDRFRRFAPFFRIYGSAGIAMVAVVSVLMTFLVFFAFHREVVQPPAPEGIFSLPNILAIPGVNQFIPFTIPVLLGIALTIAIHELGHGVLCRVEGIPVKSMGVLLFVIPIGFFVEPDEEELGRTPPVPKSRMFGAGIANNIVAGLVSFGILFLLMGMLVPVQGPVIYMIVEGSPAYNASIPLGSFILSMNGRNVTTLGEVSGILAGTRPGDGLSLTVLPAELVRDPPPGGTRPEGSTYTLNLTSYPGRNAGYAGIIFYDQQGTLGAIRSLASPLGFLFLSILPVDLLPSTPSSICSSWTARISPFTGPPSPSSGGWSISFSGAGGSTSWWGPSMPSP